MKQLFEDDYDTLIERYLKQYRRGCYKRVSFKTNTFHLRVKVLFLENFVITTGATNTEFLLRKPDAFRNLKHPFLAKVKLHHSFVAF